MNNDTDVQIDREPPKSNTKKASWLLPMGLLVALLIVIGLIFTQAQNGEAVATVDGEPITRQEFDTRLDQIKSFYEMQGMAIDAEMEDDLKQMVLDEMINETVLYVHAGREGVSASQEEIDQELQQIKDEFQTDSMLNEGMSFDDALLEQNITEDDLRKNIERRIVLNKFLEERTNIEVSEEEIQDYYESYQAQAGEDADVPPLEELRDDIERQLRTQKMSEGAMSIIEDLKAQSDIQIML